MKIPPTAGEQSTQSFKEIRFRLYTLEQKIMGFVKRSLEIAISIKQNLPIAKDQLAKLESTPFDKTSTEK